MSQAAKNQEITFDFGGLCCDRKPFASGIK